jgi:hypothetical protein
MRPMLHLEMEARGLVVRPAALRQAASLVLSRAPVLWGCTPAAAHASEAEAIFRRPW